MCLHSTSIFYEVHQGPREGAMLHICLRGEVAGEAFEERVELHRDTAFNFASVASRLAQKHGVPVSHNLIMRGTPSLIRCSKTFGKSWAFTAVTGSILITYSRTVSNPADLAGAHPALPCPATECIHSQD
jgi:hypothetical protein